MGEVTSASAKRDGFKQLGVIPFQPSSALRVQDAQWA